jgi:hypothetical protein
MAETGNPNQASYRNLKVAQLEGQGPPGCERTMRRLVTRRVCGEVLSDKVEMGYECIAVCLRLLRIKVRPQP